MPGNRVSKQGVAQMRGTILQLRKKLAAAQAELTLNRRVVRAARRYLSTGDSAPLRKELAAVGLEEPPRKSAPTPKPTPRVVTEGQPIDELEGFELL